MISTVLYTDSILKRVCLPQMRNYPHPGARIHDIKKDVIANSSNSSNWSVERVIIHVGGNNLAGYTTKALPDVAIKQMDHLLDVTQSIYPRAEVVLSAVLHRDDVHAEQVERFNHLLRLRCSMNVTYIDLGEEVYDDLYANDGIHIHEWELLEETLGEKLAWLESDKRKKQKEEDQKRMRGVMAILSGKKPRRYEEKGSIKKNLPGRKIKKRRSRNTKKVVTSKWRTKSKTSKKYHADEGHMQLIGPEACGRGDVVASVPYAWLTGIYRQQKAPKQTLYTYPENFRAYKAQIAAQYSGANLTVVQDPPQFVLGETNKSAEFLKKFPLGKVPAFEGGDGVRLSEANAIAFYVGNDELRGTNVLDQTMVQMFVNFADSELEPAVCTWVFPTMGAMQYNKQNTDHAKEELKKSLAFLNEELKTRTYLVGERITLADISVACNLLLAYKQVFEPGFRDHFGNVNRWFTTLVNQPQFKAVLGEVKLCQKMAQFDAKLYAQMSGGGKAKEGKGKDKKEKKEKGKQQPKKDKKKEQDNDVDEAPAPKPKKVVDPFEGVPKSDFVMDAWKRMYSNNDTVPTAMDYFWKEVDLKGYSLWFGEYLFPESFSMPFMASNLVGGMMQRLEKMKKYAFASICIFKDDKLVRIEGVWLWRGQDLIFEKSDDWQVDYESFKWSKMDPSGAATKLKIQEYFAQEGKFDGKEFYQGKVYK